MGTQASPAMLTFEVPEGTTQLVAYEHCNLHGLFKGDAVTVAQSETAAGRNTTCNVRFCNAQVTKPRRQLLVPAPPQSRPLTLVRCIGQLVLFLRWSTLLRSRRLLVVSKLC